MNDVGVCLNMKIGPAIARRDRAIRVAMDQFDAEIRIIIENERKIRNNVEDPSTYSAGRRPEEYNIEIAPPPPPGSSIKLPLSDLQLKDALDKIPIGSLMVAEPYSSGILRRPSEYAWISSV